MSKPRIRIYALKTIQNSPTGEYVMLRPKSIINVFTRKLKLVMPILQRS
jgi:hypothetical protein